MKKFIPMISFATILVACGYKGPLYLPKPTPAPNAKPVVAVVESQAMKESAAFESAIVKESSVIESAIRSAKSAESMPKKTLLPAFILESSTT